MSTRLGVGLVGCGSISRTYLANAPLFPAIEIVACADLRTDVAAAVASEHGIVARSPDDLLHDPAVDLVLILTPPATHGPIARASLDAGKHVHLEKPLAASVAEARPLLELAEARGLRLGCAPDTFLGGAHRAAKRLLDAGTIGRPIAGAAAMLDRGMEAWHPDPGFFFGPGGGPLFDMGPYYLTSLVSLLGPVRAVTAMATIGLDERRIGTGPRRGRSIRPAAATSVDAVLAFEAGPQVGLSMSWDVWRHDRPHLEIYGSDGSLQLPDPNWFGGDVRLAEGELPWRSVPSEPGLSAANRGSADGVQVGDYRIVGLADLAHAVAEGRPHRASAELAFHVLEVMEATLRSAEQGMQLDVTSGCECPSPLTTEEIASWMR